MGNFVNTSRKDIIDSLVVGFKERIKNPYYLHSDKKPTIVTYYSINHEKSMLDKSTGLEYSSLGSSSPLRYNQIDGFFLYGIDRITMNLEDGDYGIESSAIEGEAIILPNTIIPNPNDYFLINYTGKDILFRVNSIDTDTLDSGANFYKISYKLDQLENVDIENQIVEKYNMLIDNVGTKFKSIIQNKDYELIVELEKSTYKLKDYYKSLFYNNRVESFIFNLNEYNFYDAYMLEFIIRNKLMTDKSNYIHLTHQINPHATFSIDYDRSIFRNFEMKDKNKLEDRIAFTALVIDDFNSIFMNRKEKYFNVEYLKDLNIIDPNLEVIICVNPQLVEDIQNNILRYNDDKLFYNFIIKYFNDIDLNSDDLDSLELINYQNNIELFYMIPFIIFVIEKHIKKLLNNI